MKALTFSVAAIAFAAAGAVPALAQERGPLAMLERADANNDGAITLAEAQAARAEAFAAMDRDGDLYLSEADRAQAREARREAQIRSADADNDGRISRAEFMNQPYRGFDRFDANNNDVLEPDEIARLRQLAALRRGS